MARNASRSTFYVVSDQIERLTRVFLYLPMTFVLCRAHAIIWSGVHRISNTHIGGAPHPLLPCEQYITRARGYYPHRRPINDVERPLLVVSDLALPLWDKSG